jgi:hypothetical protein
VGRLEKMPGSMEQEVRNLADEIRTTREQADMLSEEVRILEQGATNVQRKLESAPGRRMSVWSVCKGCCAAPIRLAGRSLPPPQHRLPCRQLV